MTSFEEVKLTTPYGKEDNVLKITIDNEENGYRLPDLISESGNYFFVIWYKSDTNCTITFDIFGNTEQINSTSEWKKYSKKVSVKDLTNKKIDIVPQTNSITYFYEAFLTKGTTDTSWLPAPEDIEGEIGSVRSELRQTAESILLKVSDSNGRITTLETNLEGITGRVEDAEGNISKVAQTVDGITTEISDAKGSSTTLKARLDGIDTSVTNAEKNAKSFATQEADRVQSTVTQGYQDAIQEAESNFTQRADSIELSVNKAQESADKAQGAASDAQSRVEVTESSIKLLSDNISMLVTDGNGTSLMKQTENGWTFSTSEIQKSLNDMSKSLNDLTTEFGNTDAVLSILKQSIGDIETKTDYVNIGTWEDEPCIELGESDSDFSVMITNTRILFRVGSYAPTRITTDGLETDNITVNNEWRQGSFVWKVRANGNYGLSWKGVNS